MTMPPNRIISRRDLATFFLIEGFVNLDTALQQARSAPMSLKAHARVNAA
jgi:hypothetical protein